jgi:sugar lactone lactonase YvrE
MNERAREFVTGGRVDEFDFPSRRPAFTHMVTDADGNWWVGAADGWPGTPNPTAWDVFDPDGRFLGTVTLPEPLRVLEIGDDFVAGVAFDALDVPYAVVRDLIKP